MIPSVPLAVGTANLGPRPVSQIGDPTTEQNIKEFYRRNGGRWNRLNVNVPPLGVISPLIANSRNVRVSHVRVECYPVVVGGAVDISLWENITPRDPNGSSGQPDFVFRDEQPRTWPGLDDRTFWTIKNNGGDPVQIIIMYQEAGAY